MSAKQRLTKHIERLEREGGYSSALRDDLVAAVQAVAAAHAWFGDYAIRFAEDRDICADDKMHEAAVVLRTALRRFHADQQKVTN
jgi:hypothetical protein